MQLSKQLVLFRYILKQFGYSNFEQLRDEFNDKETGIGAAGTTYFAGALMANSRKLIDDRLIMEYDEAIQGYEKKLIENRAEPYLSFKYYQWFSLLFTEYFFDMLEQNKEKFINELNLFIQDNRDFKNIEPYEESDLNKLAYWMATGSGKTLIMHCNYWQITKYQQNWENIILITPNEGLSRQHYESFTESGIPAKLYSGSEESLKTKEGEVLIIEITKLVKEKEGEGVSVDVDYFSESRNLVFIDEGHKGQKSEEQAWKNLRNYLTRSNDSFTFEYSATFGQIISNNTKDLLQEYSRSIVFDYSYRHFYTDGYGKDFSVFNIDVSNNYSEEQNKLLFTASLLGFYEQLVLFEKYEDELRQYNIEKPLWVFVGSRVIRSSNGSLTKADKENISDVTKIVKFFRYALSQTAALQENIKNILEENSGLQNEKGDDIFKDRFEYLKTIEPKAEDILNKVFNGMGSIEAWQIKQADGEIALKTQTSDKYFAVINIGDVPKYAKTLEEDTKGELSMKDDNITRSLFQAISEPDSSIKILIGSKKFIEGWNSWRVSSMGLMNMGKGEGAQIIQLFGRGVRLKGKDFSLKREEADAPYHIKALQTISIMGLNASYMTRFLNEIEKEVPDYTYFPIDIKLNNKEKWNKQILTFKKDQEKDFREELVELDYSRDIAKRVTIDLRSKISVSAGELKSQSAEEQEIYQDNFLNEYINFIDFDNIVIEANRYKLLKGYHNLIIKKETIHELIEQGDFNLLCNNKEQFGIEEALSGKMQNIATNLVKDYINKFYADKEKVFISKHITYEMLSHDEHKEMFPASNQIVVKVPNDYEPFLKELEKKIKQLYEDDDKSLPSIHFDRHLYSPIISYAKGEKYEEIKTVPERLNEGETRFIKHLREFVKEYREFENKAVFVLRNLAKKGTGFFMESSAFYPDFIVWVIDGNHQHICFLDPKGILHVDNNFNNSKVIWCKESAPELENKIRQDLKKDNSNITISISAFILSNTPFTEVRDKWGEGMGTKKEEFEKNNVLFIEDNKDYLVKVFGG